MIQQWERLTESDHEIEYNGEMHKVSDIAKNLVRFAYLENGFNFGTKTLMSFS